MNVQSEPPADNGTVRTRIDELTAAIRELGGYDPEGWAQKEVEDNYPMIAIFLFERGLWRTINSYRQSHRWIEKRGAKEGPVRRLLAAGADPADLAALAAGVAYDVTFDVLDRLDAQGDESAPEGASGWRLMEADADGRPTRRPLDALHEWLLSFDASGRWGRDLWR